MDREIIPTGPEGDDCFDPTGVDATGEQVTLFSAAADHGTRIDRFLSERLSTFSRSYFQQLLEQGHVTLGGRVVVKAATRLKVGDVVEVRLAPTEQASAFKPEAISLDVLHEDDDLLVINKPAGLVVHPGAGNWSGTLLNGLLNHHAAAAQLPRAGIVHRLDKDTSGAMVVAKNRETMEALVRQIAARQIQRLYLAVVGRAWPFESTVMVHQAIGRDPKNRVRMAVLDHSHAGAKPAQTQLLCLQTTPQAALVAAKLFTGRTHQIRVHLSWLGCPLIADSVYGGAIHEVLARQALHAARLVFPHPSNGRPVDCRAPLPDDFQRLLQSEGLHYNPSLLRNAAFSPVR